MANLIATSAAGNALPRTIGTVTASEVSFGAITSIAPFKGQEAKVASALKSQTGLDLPAIGRTTGSNTTRATWAGLGQSFVLGPGLSPIDGAALTDQTDAWACITIEGDHARDVLARLVPADLRPIVFAIGHAMRTQLGHMNALILRTDANSYTVMVFRSMAATAAHELETAMSSIAARASQSGG